MKITEPLENAVLSLVEDDDPGYKREALDTLLRVNRIYSVRFTGSLASLNPLVDLALTDAQQYDTLKAIVDTRRAAQHKRLMFPPAEIKRTKNDAQRALMQARRARSGLALKLENARRPEGQRLRGTERLDFETRILAQWGRKLQATIDQARGRDRQRLSHDTLTRLRARFWDGIDADLHAQRQELARQGKLVR